MIMLPVKKILFLFLLLSGLLAAVYLARQRQDIRQRAFWYYRPTPAVSWLENYRVVETFPLVIDPARQEKPAIWGNQVVWQDWRVRNSTIFVYDLLTRQERRLGEILFSWEPDISQTHVLYLNINSGLVAYRLADSQWRSLGNSLWGGEIDGQRAVWLTENDTEVVLLNLDTNQFTVIHQDGGATMETPRIKGSRVAFAKISILNREGWNVQYQDLGSGQEVTVAAGVPLDQRKPDLSDKFIVWQDSRDGRVAIAGPDQNKDGQPDFIWYYYDLYGRNLESGEEFAVSFGNKNHLYPRLSDRLVVWQDNRAGNWDIYAYDLATCREFTVASGAHDEVRPVIDGEWVVWEDFRHDYDHVQYNSDIYAARLSLPDLNVTSALVAQPCPSRSAFIPLPPTVTSVPTATVPPTPTVTPTITLIPTLRPTATLTPTISATPMIIAPSLQPTPITALSDLTVAIENLGIFDRVRRRVITPTPARPIRVGDAVVFDVRARETSGVGVTNSFITRVELYRGDQLLGSYENYAAGLYGGSNFAFRVDWSKIPALGSPSAGGISPAGNYRIRVKIDSSARIAEGNEANNEAVREFGVVEN